MVWASTDIVPANLNIQTLLSLDGDMISDDYNTKIAPVSSTGAKFDFTAATSLSMNIQSASNLPAPLATATSITPTISSHDATGLGFKIAAADLTTGITGQAALNMAYTLYGSDGTTSLIIAKGNITVTLTP